MEDRRAGGREPGISAANGLFLALRGAGGLPFRSRRHISSAMNYVLALFLPPLSILLTGRVFLSIVVFLIWVPAIIFSGGLTHPMFILLAWILIYQAHQDRRAG
jgi:hypothetical protein